MRAVLLVLSSLLLAACEASTAPLQYEVEFAVRFDPPAGVAHASIALTPGSGWVSRLDLRMPQARYRNLAGDGTIERDGDRVQWLVPRAGGTLRYDVVVDHRRANGAFDARMTADYAIVRGDELFPPAKVRARRGSEASARLRIDLPKGWSDRESGYRLAPDGRFIVVNPQQRFDRPVGWIAAGDLFTRAGTVGGVDYRVTGPKGQGLDRIQIMSFLHVTTPSAVAAFGKAPEKILIVGADDPMWRGGLTGPRSIWLHSARKLQSENGTSALLHELTHAITGIHGAPGEDWIAEGIAEYYSIDLARRAGLLSDRMAQSAIRSQRRRGKAVESLRAEQSTGARTAKAVALFADLDAEIREKSAGKHSLDEVVRALMREDRVSAKDLKEATAKLVGQVDALAAI